MKVTKTSDMSLLKTIEYLIAIQGCDVCPCCGNNRMITNYCRNYAKGLFKPKFIKLMYFIAMIAEQNGNLNHMK